MTVVYRRIKNRLKCGQYKQHFCSQLIELFGISFLITYAVINSIFVFTVMILLLSNPI